MIIIGVDFHPIFSKSLSWIRTRESGKRNV